MIRQGRRGAAGERGHAGVPPESRLALGRRDLDREVVAVGHVGGAGQAVLRFATVGGRAEPRVPPRARPLAGRVDLGVVPGLLVADESPVGRATAVDARLVPGLPVHLVAAEEGQVQPGSACRLHVRPLRAGPVLVVADGDEGLVVGQQGATTIGVDPADVADVVPVALQESDHRVLVGEQVVATAGQPPRADRTVVADLEGAAVAVRRRPLVEVGSAVEVVGLPRRVGRLVDEVGVAGVVADDERDLALTAGVLAGQQDDVDARHGRRRNAPGGRHLPVAAIHQPRGGVAQARGLGASRRGQGRDQPGPVALVVPEAVHVHGVGRAGLHLEGDRAAHVDTHVRRVALDGGITLAIDVPGRRRGPRLGVLTDDRIRRSCARVTGVRERRGGHHSQTGDHQPRDRHRGQGPSPQADTSTPGPSAEYLCSAIPGTRHAPTNPHAATLEKSHTSRPQNPELCADSGMKNTLKTRSHNVV